MNHQFKTNKKMKNQKASAKNQGLNAESKKADLKNANANEILNQIAKRKYAIDYQNLSAKEQKEQRSKKRNILLNYAKLIFQLNHNADLKGKEKESKEKELKEGIKKFFKENYSIQISSSTNAKDLYNTNNEQKIQDVKNVIAFAFAK